MSSKALCNDNTHSLRINYSILHERKIRCDLAISCQKAILLKITSFAIYLTFHPTKKIITSETKNEGHSSILNWAVNTFLLHSCKHLSAGYTFEGLNAFLGNGQSFRKSFNINNKTCNFFAQCNVPLKSIPQTNPF